LLKAPAIRERIFAKFKEKISGVLAPEDQIITNGYDESGYLFYFLTNRALFVFEGRFPSQVANKNAIDSFYSSGIYGQPKKIIVDDVLNDLIQIYQTNGSYAPQHHHSQVSSCFLFPKITNNLIGKDISLYFNNIFKTHGLTVKAPVLQESLKTLREQKLAELKQLQENNCLEVIKTLLLELEPNDEAKLEDAIQIVKEEYNFSALDEKIIKKSLILVAENLEEFKFVRLTKTIKRLDKQSDLLGEEIDNLFKKFDDLKS
jgi:hypothetical protein